MGALADTAKKNSNFFKIERGESMVVKYIDYRIVPSTMDPTKDAVQYKLGTPFGDKFWTNSNSSTMVLFDTLQKDTMVRITRNPWINKDKSEDKSKSTYTVEEVKEDINTPNTNKIINPEDIQWKE